MFMDHIIQKLRKDVKRLQGNIIKERDNLVQRIQKLNLKKSFQEKKEELEKSALENLKKFEPLYQRITEDLSKRAKKAGLDLKVIEKKLSLEKKLAKKTTRKKTENKKKVTKKALSSKSKTAAKKKVTKKVNSIKTSNRKKKLTKKKVASKKPK